MTVKFAFVIGLNTKIYDFVTLALNWSEPETIVLLRGTLFFDDYLQKFSAEDNKPPCDGSHAQK